MSARVVTVFGGTGFVGRHVVGRLANAGIRVRVVCRDPESALFLKPLGNPGQIIAVKANITDKNEVAKAIEGSNAVINCTGVIASKGWNTLESVHKAGSAILAKAAKAAGIETLVHLSALGATLKSECRYTQTKAHGEEAILGNFPDATILRPALIIGAEDNFLNLFATLARWSPVLPMVNPILPSIKMIRGELYSFLIPTIQPRPTEGSSFQPVVVGDVADAVLKVLDDPDAKGETYDITGPTTYTFKRLMEMMLKATNRKACIVSLPTFWAYYWAFWLEFVPGKPFTREMVNLLSQDNLPTGDNKSLADLGLEAHSIESVLASYLTTYRPPSNRRLRPV